MRTIKNLLNLKQSGFSPIILLIVAGIVLVTIVVLTVPGFFKKYTKDSSFFQNTTIKNRATNCKSTDYGGCDDEKNFFQWKDDGLRK